MLNRLHFVVLISLVKCSICSILVSSDLNLISDGNVSHTDEPLKMSATANACNDLCITPVCVHAASSILKNMDVKVDPCDDFYKFSCGKFIENSKIPESDVIISPFSKVQKKIMHMLHDVLESPISHEDIRPFRLAKQLFKACMNESSIENVGASHVKRILKEVGGWPVLEGDKWDESSFDWKESVYKLNKIGLEWAFIIDISVGYHFKNTSIHVIEIDKPDLEPNKKYLIKGFDNKVVSAYYNYIVEIAVLFGADRVRATKELRESLEFQMALANISFPTHSFRNKTRLFNTGTISELQTKYPSIPWHDFISNLFPDSVKISLNEIVNNNIPSYLEKLEVLLKVTPKRVLANYLFGSSVASTVPFLSREFLRKKLQYFSAEYGKTEEAPRWNYCVDLVNDELYIAVGSLYTRKCFDKDAKRDGIDMANRLRSEMYKTLETVDWMDNQTRAAALDKAKSMAIHIAYADELLDDSKMETHYEKLEVNPNDFFGSILNISTFRGVNYFEKLRRPVNRTLWKYRRSPTNVNAEYDENENSIGIPAGLFQGIFFNKDLPRYLNYGAIGVFIGHEMTHAFDDEGRQFDKDGNLRDWWQKETKQKYLEKAQCLIRQYSNYTVKQVNLKLNGFNTQGENIADNGGIKEAYGAYTSWLSENGPEKHLPGLQMFSPRQMFWIATANALCSVVRSESLENLIYTDVHSPDEFRIIGAFSNQDSFGHDFNCPLGSKMNPIKKCSVW